MSHSLTLGLCWLCASLGGTPDTITVDVAREFVTLTGRAVDQQVEIERSDWSFLDEENADDQSKVSLANGTRAKLKVPVSGNSQYTVSVANWITSARKKSFYAPPGSSVIVQLSYDVNVKTIYVFPPLQSKLHFYVPRDQTLVSATLTVSDEQEISWFPDGLKPAELASPIHGATATVVVDGPRAPPNSVQVCHLTATLRQADGTETEIDKDVVLPGGDNAQIFLAPAITETVTAEPFQSEYDRFVLRQIDAILAESLGGMADRSADTLVFPNFSESFQTCISHLNAVDDSVASTRVQDLRKAYVAYFTELDDLAKNGMSTPARVGSNIAVGGIQALFGLGVAALTGGETTLLQDGLETLGETVVDLAVHGGEFEKRVSEAQTAIKNARALCSDLETNLGSNWWWFALNYLDPPRGGIYAPAGNGLIEELAPDRLEGKVRVSQGKLRRLGEDVLISWPSGGYEIGTFQPQASGLASYKIIDHSSDETQKGVEFQFSEFSNVHGGFTALENPSEVPIKYSLRWYKADGSATSWQEHTIASRERRWHWMPQAFHCEVQFDESFDDGYQPAVHDLLLEILDAEPTVDPFKGRCWAFKVKQGQVTLNSKIR